MILDKKNQKITPGNLLLIKNTEDNKVILYRGLVRSIDKESVSLNIDNKFITVPVKGREVGDALVLDNRKHWAVIED
jgi:hypothetical protein